MIRSKVLEIDIDLVKYKRSGYLNGPTYSIPRVEVYAINYPDGKSDYLTVPGSGDLFNQKQEVQEDTVERPRRFDVSRGARLSIGLGFIRAYSKGEESLDGLSQKSLLPGFNLRYSFSLLRGLRFGMEVSTASYNFKGDGFDSYDDVAVSGNVEENTFGLSGYALYELDGGKFRPYIMLGVGIRTSSTDTQLTVAPFDTQAGYLINSGTRNTGFGVLARAGASLSLIENMDAYADIGTGLSLIQTGITFRLNNKKLK